MWRTKMPERWNYRGGGLSGFTLTELLITIAVIAILASALLPSIGRARTRAKIGKVEQELDGQRGQIEEFYADHDTYPPIGGDAYLVLPKLGGGPCTWVDDTNGWDTDGDQIPDCPWLTEDRNHNYALDSNEDVGIDAVATGTEVFGQFDSGTNPDGTGGNRKLDWGFSYRDFTVALIPPDIFAGNDGFGKKIKYHYYPGSSIVKYRDTSGNLLPADYDPTVYNRTATVANERTIRFYDQYVLYSVGPNGKDEGLYSADEAAQDANSDGILDYDYRRRSSGEQRMELFEPTNLNPDCRFIDADGDGYGDSESDCLPGKFLLPRRLPYYDSNFEQLMDDLQNLNVCGTCNTASGVWDYINNNYPQYAKYFTDQGRKGIIVVWGGNLLEK